MSSNAKRKLIVIGIVVAMGLALFWWRTPADVRMGDSAIAPPATSGHPSSAATSTLPNSDSTKPLVSNQSAPVAETTRGLRTEPVDDDSHQALRSPPDSGVRDHLEAEAQLLGPQIKLPDGTFATGMDVKAGGAIMKGEGFDLYMDALAKQASNDQLAIDLTDLYFGAANDAAKSVEGVIVQRVVCGLRTCLGTATAPSLGALDPWLKSFTSARPVHPYALGVHPHQMSDGTFEFRMSFSTDPSIKAAYGRPGK